MTEIKIVIPDDLSVSEAFEYSKRSVISVLFSEKELQFGKRNGVAQLFEGSRKGIIYRIKSGYVVEFQ